MDAEASSAVDGAAARAAARRATRRARAEEGSALSSAARGTPAAVAATGAGDAFPAAATAGGTEVPLAAAGVTSDAPALRPETKPMIDFATSLGASPARARRNARSPTSRWISASAIVDLCEPRRARGAASNQPKCPVGWSLQPNALRRGCKHRQDRYICMHVILQLGTLVTASEAICAFAQPYTRAASPFPAVIKAKSGTLRP